MNLMLSKSPILIVIFIFLGCKSSNGIELFDKSTGSDSLNAILPIAEYQHDFNQMFETLVDKHPQPFAFITEDSLNNLAKVQYNKITDSTTIAEFLWICTRVVAAIKCGHTSIWTTKLIDIPKSYFFPMEVKYVGSRLYIINAKENAGELTVGDEILTINGVGVEKIQKEMFEYRYADGHNQTRKFEDINRNFIWLCPMYFSFPPCYTVTVAQKGIVEKVDLKATEDINARKTFLDACEDQLCFDINQNSNTAIITIRSFSFYNNDLPVFQSFIDSCFNQIKANNIENLIIDLRNNGGGDPFCGSYLLQHIANKPYTYFHKDVAGYQDIKKSIEPNENRFKGKPFILINGLCFSTTGHFCSLVKENNFGVLVGDETGGTFTCNDNSKEFTLKNTQFNLRTAQRIYKTTASALPNDHGILPDHYVTSEVEDIISNTDKVLNYTINLIETKKK